MYKQAKKKRKKPVAAASAAAAPEERNPDGTDGNGWANEEEQEEGEGEGEGFGPLGLGDGAPAASRPRPRRASATSSVESSAVMEISRKFGIFAPFSSDLIGSEFFRLANIEVPSATRPHLANRELFLQDIYDHLSSIYAGRRDLAYVSNKFPLSKYCSDIDLHTMISPFSVLRNFAYLLYPKYRAEVNLGTYLIELLRAACSVNLSMQPRIRPVRPAREQRSDESVDSAAAEIQAKYSEACASAAADLEVVPLAPSPPPFNIVVLDVFVDIPRPALKGDAAARRNRRQDSSSSGGDDEADEDRELERGAAVGKTSVVETVKNSVSKTLFGASGATKAKKEPAAPPKKLNCSLHYAVGVFPSTLPRPPPSVDMSLMSWDIVRDKGETPDTLAAKNGNNRQSVYKRKTEWTTSRSLPGVGMTNKRHPSGSNIHFRILKNPLPKDDIEQIVPKKFRIWLGLDY